MPALSAVVSLLDDTHDRMVRALWEELEERIGLEGVARRPIPHLTWHVAASYDMLGLESLLTRFAARMIPFRVRTNALSFFPGENPVLFLSVVRDPRLTMSHRSLGARLLSVSVEPSPNFLPENWVPHLTLAAQGIDPEKAAAAVKLLVTRDFRWEIPIGNLAVLQTGDPDRPLPLRIDFPALLAYLLRKCSAV